MDIFLNGSFLKTVNGSLSQVSFNLQDSVQDEVRGYLVYQNSIWSFIGIFQYAVSMCKKQCKKLALILESPHKDEYSDSYVPLRPANGKTGNNINQKLSNRAFVRKLDKESDYQVLIMNPIQVQCSCYHQLRAVGRKSTPQTTNTVFRILFNKKNGNLRDGFKQRIVQYNPDFVLNCSTYGVKAVIETSIYEALNRHSGSKDVHPSVW